MQLSHRTTRRFAAALAVGAMSAGAVAGPAVAASPVVTGGLVNVTIVDAVDISRVTVQLPIGVAANVCNVDVSVLSAQLANTGTAACNAVAGAQANGPRG